MDGWSLVFVCLFLQRAINIHALKTCCEGSKKRSAGIVRIPCNACRHACETGSTPSFTYASASLITQHNYVNTFFTNLLNRILHKKGKCHPDQIGRPILRDLDGPKACKFPKISRIVAVETQAYSDAPWCVEIGDSEIAHSASFVQDDNWQLSL